MDPEIDLYRLPTETWKGMREAAVELDLVHGGYFRSRPNAVLFYCDPDTAPDGWTFGFADGSPEMPRALVGTAETSERPDKGEVAVRLTISNWAAVRSVKEAYDRGEFRGRFQEYVLAQEGALRGRPEDRAWLRGQFLKLQAHAAGLLVDGA